MPAIAPKSSFQEVKAHSIHFLLHIHMPWNDMMPQQRFFFLFSFLTKGSNIQISLPLLLIIPLIENHIDGSLTVTKQRRSFRHKLFRLSEPSAQSNESKLSIKFWERDPLSIKTYQITSLLCLCPTLGYVTQGQSYNIQWSNHMIPLGLGLARLDKEREGFKV